VSVDLREALLTPGSNAWAAGSKVWFRLDPHEFHEKRRFCLDYVRLTGDDRAGGQYVISHRLSDPGPGKPAVSFFYTKTPGATAGGTPIACQGSTAGGACRWNTRNVAKGLYYIYARATDGRNTTFTPSDTGVTIS
jgi:hypothetical protein